MKRLAFVVLMVVVPAIVFGAETVYVQSFKAKVMQAPSFKSKVVGVAKRGDALTAHLKKGRWFRVTYMGKTGWVPALVVKSRPPMRKVSVFTGQEERIGVEARRRASQVTSAAAARGLTDDDRQRVGHKGVVDYGTLERIEALNITEREIEEFQKGMK